MNDYPCPLCNHFRNNIARAIVKHEYAEIKRLENEQFIHRMTCEIYNSSWYLGLWSNAVIGVNVVEMEA